MPLSACQASRTSGPMRRKGASAQPRASSAERTHPRIVSACSSRKSPRLSSTSAGSPMLSPDCAMRIARAAVHTCGVDLDLVFLGTSGSMPTAFRGAPSLLVRRGGERLLFDCGEGTQRQLLLSSIGLLDLREVSFTHYHADHY